MKTQIICFLALSFFITSCSQTVRGIKTDNVQQFGAPVTTEGVIRYEDMVKKVKTDGGFEGKVIGNVDAVCQVRGCWMNIVSEKIEDEMFVKFQDYEFFVPLDCMGKRVVMEGSAYIETTSVADLRHYAEDEGLSQEEIEKITEPESELKFMATGVLLLNE